MDNCGDCKFFWFKGPSIDQPHPEFACTKGHWDGAEDTDSFYDERECSDFYKRPEKRK